MNVLYKEEEMETERGRSGFFDIFLRFGDVRIVVVLFPASPCRPIERAEDAK